MKKIYNRGNMPPHIALLAKTLDGQLSGASTTEFWEMSSVTEFEKKAVDIGYEIIPAMDSQTNRCYLVGFDVEEPKYIVGTTYAKLLIYFIELNEGEFKAWVKKIRSHRKEQLDDTMARREREEKKRKKSKIKGVNDNDNRDNSK